jgi:4-amino-4-deoxy-L-arabinose transferase-like glycosyltransferase
MQYQTNNTAKTAKINYLYILGLSLILFYPFLGQVHLFDWDEINFAEAAREMLVTGDYLTVQINFQPFWEKPPLFIWMQALSMKIFGINEFAARFPNAVCGSLTLLFLFHAGSRLKDSITGWLWLGLYVGSVLPFFYFKSGIIDPWFNLFIFGGVWFTYLYIHERKKASRALLAGVSLGLAVLTKGPVGFLLYALTVGTYRMYMTWKHRSTFQWNRPSLRHILLFFLCLIITGGLWFILQIAMGNYQIVMDFVAYQIRLFHTKDAGHGGFLLYHFVVILLGVFPASAFVLPWLLKRYRRQISPFPFNSLMAAMLVVVLLVFTIVKTKILHYSSLAYFPLTWLGAVYLLEAFKQNHISRLSSIFLWIIGGIYTLLMAFIPFVQRLKDADFIQDEFARANLQAEVTWTGLEWLPALLLVAALILFKIYKKNRLKKAICILLTGSTLFILSTMVLIVGRVEGYTQRAAIEFYKQMQGEDVYIETLGFKSYAHLFYSKKRPPAHPEAASSDWLRYGHTDKPVFFVTKVDKVQRYLEEIPDLEEIYRKNGFVFCKRER